MYEQVPYDDNEKRYDLIEFVENPEPRCPYIILLDTSSSMEGEPIEELNKGLKIFKKELLKNELAAKRVELGIIAFNDEAVALTDGFVSPKVFKPMTLEAGGVTRMCDAIKLAGVIMEARKQQYKSAGIKYYRPWIVLITDGEPTDAEGNILEYESSEFKNTVELVHKGVSENKFSFFSIGVGEYVNMQSLEKISAPNRPPKRLSGVKFSELFKWLSNSASTRSSSVIGEVVKLPTTDGWAED